MIAIKLHGTSGSGKSWVAHQLLGRYPNSSHPEGFTRVDVPRDMLPQPLIILGKYDTNCGGMDTMTAGEGIALFKKCALLDYNIFYEGLLQSEYWGKIGSELEFFPHIYAFMDTPIEVCIERVKARRLAKGNTKPLDETNTRDRVRKIDNLRRKLNSQGKRVALINHEHPLEDLLELYAQS